MKITNINSVKGRLGAMIDIKYENIRAESLLTELDNNEKLYKEAISSLLNQAKSCEFKDEDIRSKRISYLSNGYKEEKEKLFSAIREEVKLSRELKGEI